MGLVECEDTEMIKKFKHNLFYMLVLSSDLQNMNGVLMRNSLFKVNENPLKVVSFCQRQKTTY
jgi:hypothetical protein